MQGSILNAGSDVSQDDAGLIKESTTATFMADVVDASHGQTVLVEFWAPWSKPCKQLTPVLEKLVKTYKGKVRLVKINADENQAIAGQLRVQSLPTVLAFKDGKPVDGFMDAQPESVVKEFIDRIAGADEQDEIANVIDSAEQALEAGDLQGAAEAFAAVLQVNQQNPDALAGLARCYLASGDRERAQQTINLVPPDKSLSAKVEGVRAALELAEAADNAGDHKELERKVAANPRDHQARLDLAIALAAAGRKSEAVDHLLGLVEQDRNWNDEAARKQLLKFFEAWGSKDPLTNEGRRRLSSVLFS